MKSYRELEIGMIEQGRLISDFDAEFLEIQKKICAYVKKHGDKANGAKGELTLKITLKCENHEEGVFSVRADMASKIPTRPPRSTISISEEDENGQMCLFGRASGTTKDNPRQGVICTDDGEMVDQETGEVVGEEK